MPLNLFNIIEILSKNSKKVNQKSANFHREKRRIMINKIVLEDKIILYWSRDKDFVKGYKYCICYDKEIIYTEKTHCTIEGLINKQSLKISVSMVDERNNVVKEYERENIYFPLAKRRLDVTKPPYNAVGDGKTLNTVALQRAFDDCKAGETVYVPCGTFLTGALTIHSNTELYLEENAVIQGTDNPNDYLPKIKSRLREWNV